MPNGLGGETKITNINIGLVGLGGFGESNYRLTTTPSLVYSLLP